MDIFEDFDAAYGHGTYTSMSDGIGGHNILHGGKIVGHEAPLGMPNMDGSIRTPNALGGTDVSKAGHQISHSIPNAMGGMNVYHGTSLHHITFPNVQGGVDVYDHNMHLEGRSMDNDIGGENYLAFSGNTAEISQYENPLAHSAKCRFEPFDVKGGHI